jgi:cytochrome P450
MRHYAEQLNRGIADAVAGWADRPMRFYDAIKQLSLDLAATSFLGMPLGPEAARVNKAFVDEVQASIAPVRSPIRGTAMHRGVKARDYLMQLFLREIPARRNGDGQDFFSQFCRAVDEDGQPLGDQAIADHMNFLMMAAHDTITSSATSLVMLLGRNVEWQDRLREEIASLGLNDDEGVPYGQLDRLVLTEYAFKEALRIMPPVPSMPRRALRDFEFRGYRIPAGTFIGINIGYTHHMAEHWPDPDRFDPMRFTPEASRGRHKYAWVPFGGGAHMCLGLHFAYMQAKCFARHFLQNLAVSLPPGYTADWQMWPIPKPRDGLRVIVKPA